MCYIVFLSHSLHWRFVKIALREYVIKCVMLSSSSIVTYMKIEDKYKQEKVLHPQWICNLYSHSLELIITKAVVKAKMKNIAIIAPAILIFLLYLKQSSQKTLA